jgi:hypothetical protein
VTPWDKVQVRSWRDIIITGVLKVAVCRQPLSFSFSCKECNLALLSLFKKMANYQQGSKDFITQTLETFLYSQNIITPKHQKSNWKTIVNFLKQKFYMKKELFFQIFI